MARRWLLGTLLGFFLTPVVFASGPTGTITGTVTDPSGAIVPKARITVVNQATNATRDAQTNDDGDFTVALLPPGRYQVTAESAGFRKSLFSDVTVDVDQTVRVDFALVVGAPTEEVKVKDTPPAIQTDTSTLGQVVNNRLVQELPLNERNFLNFALLVPGSQLPVEGSENSTQGGSLSVNGAREQSNNFLLDGVDNNDPYINQYVALPSVDAIQEFKVQSSDYSAEYGRGSGAQINVVLKSGTNTFHGTLFEYFRNRNLDAKNYFDLPDCAPTSAPNTCGPIPGLQRNQFGGTLGGPIFKDKTFFFVSYEGLRLRQANTRTANVPSQVEWEAVEGTNGFPANPVLTDMLFAIGCPNASKSYCQVGHNLFDLYPQANVGTAQDLPTSNRYLSAPVIRNTENHYTAKVDQHFSSVDTVSAHYSLIDQDLFSPFDLVNAFTSLPGYGSYTLNHGQNAGLEWTRVFHSRLLNELRLGFIRMRATVLQQNHGTNYNAALDFPSVLTNPQDLGYPDLEVQGFDGIGEPVNYPQDRHDTTLQLADNVAWTVGRNQFKLGADVHHVRIDDYLDFLARGEWLFLGDVAQQVAAQGFTPPFACSEPGCSTYFYQLSQVLAGVPDAATTASGNTYNSLRSYGVSSYVQDDIHVIPRFLLNVGLRYEYNSPPIEALNRFSVPNLSPSSATCTPTPDCQFIQAGTDGVPRATYSPTYTDIGPRIGFAWRPLKSERWVVRSAYGIFYDSTLGQINVFPRINPPYYNLSLFENGNCPPFGLCNVQNVVTPTGSSSGLVQDNMIAPNFRDGYMQQWNADLQYEVLPNWMVDAAYVGSKGTHLANVIDLNQQNPITGMFPYPQFASILYVESEATSNYHSLQLRSEKRTQQGLTLLLAYTYSKSFDDISAVFGGSVGSGLAQNSQNIEGDRGPSDFNAVHRFVGSFVYDLPLRRMWAHGPGWSGRLLNNWQAGGIVTAQTGSPFTVVLAGGNSSADAAFGNPARPNLVGNPFEPGPVAANPSCNNAPSQVRVAENWFNPCAFALPAAGAVGGAFAYGTEGRNILTGPGFTNIDFGLSKSMALGSENHRLMLRGDFFNLLNHPNFDIPEHVFNCQPAQVCSPYGGTSFGQVLSANSYGSRPPRQIQLSARYVF